MELEVTVSWYYVGIEAYVAGVNVAQGGIGRDDRFWSVSFIYKGVKFTVGVNAVWDGGYDVRLDATGEACVLGQCVSGTRTISP